MICAVMMLLTTIPVIAILALIVSLDGRAPIFAHKRVGRNGQHFGCLKIRTMYPDADERLMRLFLEQPEREEEWKKNFKLRDDPRITRIGRFLRKTSLDELPQLFNVLKGEMSLVGPRPVTEPEVALYGRHAEAYHAVRPGLTGLWQVSGRNAVTFQERAWLDATYVADIGFLSDLGIMARTLPAITNLSGR